MVCHFIEGSFGFQLYFRAATSAQVGGFSNGSQRGFRTRDDAQAAWDHALANGTVGPPLSSPTRSVGVASAPLSPPSNNRLPPRTTRTLPTSLSGLELPVVPGTPQRASQQPINIPPSPTPSIPRTTQGNLPPPILSGTQASVPRSPLPVISTRQIAHYRLSDEDAYWVVVSGANLGVYHGK